VQGLGAGDELVVRAVRGLQEHVRSVHTHHQERHHPIVCHHPRHALLQQTLTPFPLLGPRGPLSGMKDQGRPLGLEGPGGEEGGEEGGKEGEVGGREVEELGDGAG